MAEMIKVGALTDSFSDLCVALTRFKANNNVQNMQKLKDVQKEFEKCYEQLQKNIHEIELKTNDYIIIESKDQEPFDNKYNDDDEYNEPDNRLDINRATRNALVSFFNKKENKVPLFGPVRINSIINHILLQRRRGLRITCFEDLKCVGIGDKLVSVLENKLESSIKFE